MKKSGLVIFILFFIVHLGIAQITTTFSIDFGYKTLSTTACNIFGANVTVDNYVHQTTIGFPTFTGASDYWINLPCKRNSPTSQTGTEYQIIFPFKQGSQYQINVYYKGTVAASNELYPQLALGLNQTKKTQNTSTSCGGSQPVSPTDYLAFAASGSSLAWSANPIINTGTLDKDYESLSVASFPWPANTATGTQKVQVRQVVITEITPIIAPPTTGFETNFYKNTVNGKTFIGMRGKYRPFVGNNLYASFAQNSISFINVNTDPSSNLIGENLAPTEGWLYDGEITELSSLFIIDEWTNKKYFVEAKRNTYTHTIQTVEFHCTDITDVNIYNNYKFEIDPSQGFVWTFNSSNGYKVLFDGALHSLGGGASAYFIKSPDLP